MNSSEESSAWTRRRDRVMGKDPDDPSVALGNGEWRLDPKTRAQRWVPKPSATQDQQD